MDASSRIRAWRVVVMAAFFQLFPGCGAQDWWLGSQEGVLLQGFDTVTTPGESAALAVSLRGGALMSGLSDYTVIYALDGRRLGAAKTDADGIAVIRHSFDAPGLYALTASLDSEELGSAEVPTCQIQAGVFRPDRRMIVVDLDKTLVADGFDVVLLGEARPMPDARAVMEELARNYQILYLTHRPEYLARRSRQWLTDNHMPPGPLLVSRTEEFLAGSEAFKTGTIEQLKKTFPSITAGVGDKISDILAYHANGLTAILIVQPDTLTPSQRADLAEALDELPPTAHVVDHWRQVSEILSGRANYPPSATQARLLEGAAQQETGP